MILEELEARKDPLAAGRDHEEDKLKFEISVVNKRNEALSINCWVDNGRISMGQVRVFSEDGIKQAQMVPSLRTMEAKRLYQGARYMYLSEPLQSSLVQYMYEVGVHPDLALCLEYLSWSKEQRTYMTWIGKMFFYFFELQESLNRKQISTESQ